MYYMGSKITIHPTPECAIRDVYGPVATLYLTDPNPVCDYKVKPFTEEI